MKLNKLLGLILLLSVVFVNAQEKKIPKVKWGLTTQFWLRHSELNNGTTVNGEKSSQFTDVSMRRLRIPVSSQLTPKLYAAVLFGGNNYNSSSKNFSLAILDLYAEYAFDKTFEIGIGKSAWQGLSRFNVFSAKKTMGVDVQLFSLTTVDKSDQAGRNLGVWFKGQKSGFDYRFTLSNPIAVSYATGKAPFDTHKINFANNRPRVKVSTYVKYQFLENESNKTAYQVGTYINKRKIWNIGMGAQYQKKAMTDGTNFYDMKHWAVDSFLSLPLANGNGITAYMGYFNYNFGKNYVRNINANGSSFGGGTDFNGAGVGFPAIGTGNTLFGQFGYAIAKKSVIIQPNVSVQYSKWNALKDPMVLSNFAVNFFLNNKGHSNKLTLAYQLRPIFDKVSLEQKGNKGMLVLKYQISLK